MSGDWREELIEKMARHIAVADDTTPDPNSEWCNENWHCWIPDARAALAVAEPVIREQCEQIRHQQEVEALREENARLREALKPFSKNYWSDDWHDSSDCEINVQLRDIRRAAAAIREGGNEN